MTRKYELPDFLIGVLKRDRYIRWLQRKAVAHVRRDKKRGNRTATVSAYKEEIHRAVQVSNGFDSYTGESLDWSLVSKWTNERTRDLKYRVKFAKLPTVDHESGRLGQVRFKICGLQTNGAKSDLSLDKFLDLCKTVLCHNHRICSVAS